MDKNNSKSNLSTSKTNSSKPKPKRKLWWLWLLLAVLIVAGIVVIVLLLTGVIGGGSSESSPGPSPSPRPSPGPSPSPGPNPGPNPSPGPSPSPSPGPSPVPNPSPGPSPGPTPPPPVSIEPENYTQSIDCVVSSDNPNCYTTSSAITDFTYNQATTSDPGVLVNTYAAYGPTGAQLILGPLVSSITTPAPGAEAVTYPVWKVNSKSNSSLSNGYASFSALTQYLGLTVNPPFYTSIEVLPANVNFKLEVYPTPNKTTEIEVSTTKITDGTETTITKTYDFSPVSDTQYYLVVFTTNGDYANQYPLYIRYRPNGTPYAIVYVNNFISKLGGAELYFYITDNISDLETIYSSGTITEDENCISYPDHVTIANVAFTEVTQADASTSDTIDINCVLNSGLGNCYNNPSSWDYNNNIPSNSDSGYNYDALVFTPISDSSSLSIVNVSKTSDGNPVDELSIAGDTSSGLCLPDVEGRGVSLQNTSSSPINISLLLEINPSGESDRCSTSEDSEPIIWSDLQPNLYYLVVFATNGIYANQFPLYFDTYTYTPEDTPAPGVVASPVAAITMTTAYAEASNLVLEDICDLYFCITDSLLDLSTVYTNSSGSWTIDASIVAAPLQVIIKNVKYVNL